MKSLIKLIILILQKGNFRYSGADIAQNRNQVIARFERSKQPVQQGRLRHTLMKNPYLGRLISEAAYIRNALATKGGHLYLGEQNLAYVRIPRVASTSLSQAILLANFPHLREHELTPDEINFLTDHHLQSELAKDDSRRDIFTVVRNPFSRLVSVYRTFFELRYEPFLYEDYLFGILPKNHSFKEFVKTLTIIPDRFKDQHVRPQHRFLRYYEQRNIPVKIMRLEEPEKIRDFLQARGLSFEVVNRSSPSYDYRRYYDRETLHFVSEMYRTDLERFGYENVVREIEFSIEQSHVRM